MGLTTRFIPHSVELTSGPTWINQIEATTPEGGVELFEETAGSQTDREFVAIKAINPTMPFTTSDLSVLSTVGFSGVALANAGQTLAAYGRQLPLGSLPTSIASLAHLKLACTDGLLVPMGVSCAHNAVAKLSLHLHGILATGGGATPFVFSAAQAIPAGAGQVANVYTTGPVKYTAGGSRLVQGIENLGIQFGLGVHKEGTDGEVYPSHVSIISRMPRLDFTTKDAAIVAEIGDGLSVSAFAMYFRAVAANGQRVAAATTSHISISATAGVIVPSNYLNLSHKQSGAASFSFVPALNASLITISTSAAIPTS